MVGALEGAQPEAWHTTCRAVGVGGGAALGKDQILEKQKTWSWPGTKFVCKSSKAGQ